MQSAAALLASVLVFGGVGGIAVWAAEDGFKAFAEPGGSWVAEFPSPPVRRETKAGQSEGPLTYTAVEVAEGATYYIYSLTVSLAEKDTAFTRVRTRNETRALHTYIETNAAALGDDSKVLVMKELVLGDGTKGLEFLIRADVNGAVLLKHGFVTGNNGRFLSASITAPESAKERLAARQVALMKSLRVKLTQ